MARLSFKRHRFPPEIIQHAAWLYFRFTLSFRDVEELLAPRGIGVSYETVRYWTKSGLISERRLNDAIGSTLPVSDNIDRSYPSLFRASYSAGRLISIGWKYSARVHARALSGCRGLERRCVRLTFPFMSTNGGEGD